MKAIQPVTPPHIHRVDICTIMFNKIECSLRISVRRRINNLFRNFDIVKDL